MDELPSNQCDRYRRYITKFDAVSVREKTAADIIERLGCARPKVVLDPTMLLSVEQWKNIINQSKVKFKKKYVVAYFLGVRTEAYDTYIQRMAQRMNSELIDIMRLSPNEKSKIGPAEFLWLLYHSEAVFTDSFHGTVFSILFHKPFVVFERPDEKGYGKMSSRLDTLLDTFDLNKQRAHSEEQLESINMKWDSLRIDENLKRKREYSIEFLKKALND